jgi:hypothetical protein
MDEKILDQLLNELLSAFEDAETHSTAILLFLKAQGIATEEKLAPFLDQAGKASDVRWRAARARMGALMHSAIKPVEPSEKKKDESGAAKKSDEADADGAVRSQSKDKVQSGEKSENTPKQNENMENTSQQNSDNSKGSDDAKAEASGKHPVGAKSDDSKRNSVDSQQTRSAQTGGSETSPSS